MVYELFSEKSILIQLELSQLVERWKTFWQIQKTKSGHRYPWSFVEELTYQTQERPKLASSLELEVNEASKAEGDLLEQKVTSLNGRVESAPIPTAKKTDLKAKISVLQNQVVKAKKKTAEENIQKAIKDVSEKAASVCSEGKGFCIAHVSVGSDNAAMREAVVRVMEQKGIAVMVISTDEKKTLVCSELPTGHVINSYQHNISSASYGPNWCLFRRNMVETIMHTARLKTFSGGREWVLGVLIQRLLSESRSDVIKVVDHFQYAMFCLLVYMCFGEKLEDEKIREIEKVQRNLLMSVFSFNFLNIWPKLGRIIFRKKWKKLIGIREDQDNVLIPIIKTRLEKVMKQEVQDDAVVAYVDSLANLKLLEEGNRKLRDEEMVSLCGEFLNGGTDTTSNTLQWIMANLVKYPHGEVSVVGDGGKLVEMVVKEEELKRMPYLKAVVLEEMGRDGEVWKDPLEFRPERFLSGNGGEEGFDITCSREIKMMPFGAGRRMCPGYTLALLHLEYFVANLVFYLEWRPAVGNYEVDFSKKQEFTVGMKNPLLVSISRRVKHSP
ncbi:hypothetical protein POM88_001260 [Heracleum sosnowskyi]|uniref:Cytochrome P450 n=1 Tax=Heracleum sosnowskyi TaxID=360622 RepID=A0AAD8N4U2_9APIA|nr:hypothetical protein POM88_001260 [Heracleum sosnowskyi]